ncbi:MAG: DUF1572 domain-containing protein [Saprospiraceae bacterium]|nr:DUF1572 domain-containing protein [Saprospiraceae bacterium]
MNTAQKTANRFREVLLSGKWIANTNIYEQISDLPLSQALKRVQGCNSIALLTFHLHYYIAGILQVFEGGTLDIRDKYSFDMPDLTEENQWENMKQKLWADAEKFASHVEKLSDEQLNSFFVDEKYGSYQRNIDAMIEHSYYHMGQIVLLKKILD